ncbi:MAG: response regulator [Defluviitaleaceae bacterium]|nr:response regulator [Defluviitaleaceae bacterium]
MENYKNPVLVVDDDRLIIAALKAILEEYFEIQAATSGEQALAMLKTNYKPDLILLDINMGGLNGFQVIRQLKDDPATKEIPVVFLTSHTDSRTKEVAANFGAIDYLNKPFDETSLLNCMLKHLKPNKKEVVSVENKPSVLMVDDDILIISTLTKILSPFYNLRTASSGEECLKIIKKEQKPDLIILDITLGGITGFDVIKQIKVDYETKDIPIIFLTSHTNRGYEEQGLSLGAADYIHKPFVPEIVRLRVKNQMHIINQLRTIQELSLTDTLTGAFNRRYFDDRLDLEWRRAIRHESSIGLLILDIDDFKWVNDNYGHLVGDIVLKNLVNVIKPCISRAADLLARWGGEEFAVILPGTHLEGTVVVAERIRETVEATKNSQNYKGNDDIYVTVSIGANNTIPKTGSTMESFVYNTDKALYLAKEQGKNRVAVASEEW